MIVKRNTVKILLILNVLITANYIKNLISSHSKLELSKDFERFISNISNTILLLLKTKLPQIKTFLVFLKY
jgi:hypothetical protein